MEDGGWFFTADDADGADKGLLFAGIFLNGQPDSGINTGQDARLSGRLEANACQATVGWNGALGIFEVNHWKGWAVISLKWPFVRPEWSVS
jgi:hypothetical protein